MARTTGIDTGQILWDTVNAFNSAERRLVSASMPGRLVE
jgi:hypothetical protein